MSRHLAVTAALLLVALTTSACGVFRPARVERGGGAVGETTEEVVAVDDHVVGDDPWLSDCLTGDDLGSLDAEAVFTTDVDGDGLDDTVFAAAGDAAIGGYVERGAGGWVTIPRGPNGEPGTPLAAFDVDGEPGTELLVHAGGNTAQLGVLVQPSGCSVRGLPEGGADGHALGFTVEVFGNACGPDCGAWIRCLPAEGGGPPILENGTFSRPPRPDVPQERWTYTWSRTRHVWNGAAFTSVDHAGGDLDTTQRTPQMHEGIGCTGWAPVSAS